MSPRRTRAARRAEVGNSLLSGMVLPDEMSLPKGVMEPVREPMEDPILESTEEPASEKTRQPDWKSLPAAGRGRKPSREPLGETAANLNQSTNQNNGRKKSNRGMKRNHTKKREDVEEQEHFLDLGNENGGGESSDSSGEPKSENDVEITGEEEVITTTAGLAIDGDADKSDLNESAQNYENTTLSQTQAQAREKQLGEVSSSIPNFDHERVLSDHTETMDDEAIITGDKIMVEEGENGFQDGFVQDETHDKDQADVIDTALMPPDGVFYERDYSAQLKILGQEETKDESYTSFNFDGHAGGSNIDNVTTASHLSGHSSSRQGHKRVSEAVQKLEALFEPSASSNQDDVEMSTILDILARAPGLESSECVVEPTDLDTNIGVTEQVKDSANVSTQASRTLGEQDTLNSSKYTVTVKATSTTRKSSVQASTRVSSQHMTLSPIKNDGIAKVKERSAITALHTPPPVAKSDKPPTRAKFQLPGDLISAKLKLQREERLKREAEEEQKKREFKAKPIAKFSKPVTIKTNASSRARMSLAGKGSAENTVSSSVRQSITSEMMRRRSAARVRPSIMSNAHHSNASAKVPARHPSFVKSMLETKAGEGDAPVPVSATTGKKSEIGSSNAAKLNRHRMSVPGPAKNNTRTPITRASMAAKGKDIINRERAEKEEKEKATHAKTEATNKARAEAAERGRIASREWAEKKKAAVGRNSAIEKEN